MKKYIKQSVASFTLIMTAMALTGCMSSQSEYGQAMDSKVGRIQKGVTTRGEVEAWFGHPMQVAMLGDGKRMLYYCYSNSNVDQNGVSKASSAMSSVPLLGMLAGAAIPGAGAIGMAGSVGGFAGGQNQCIRSQNLSVRINADNIVEDFEFSDTSTDTQAGFGGVTQTMRSNAAKGDALAPSAKPALVDNVSDTEAKLKALQDLKENGILTETEYQTKRKAILDRM